MRRTLVFALAALALCGCEENPSRPAPVAGMEFQHVAGWPNLPEGEVFGEVTGVAADTLGQVYVVHRAGVTEDNSEIIANHPIFIIDQQTGELIDKWGGGMFVQPYGAGVDGDDHLWVTDIAQNSVFEFSLDGTVLRRLDGGPE